MKSSYLPTLVRARICTTQLIKSLLVCVLLSSCEPDPEPSTKSASPEVDRLVQGVKNDDMLSFVIYHQNSLEAEFLFDGKTTTGYDLRSATKSITTTLIGIAIDKGIIASENETIAQYIEPLVGPLSEKHANLRIIDLMTMTGGGVDQFFNSDPYFAWLNSSDPLQHIFTTSLSKQPGTFSYNNELMYLLSVILQQASGMSEREFARIHLFEPMEIEDRGWETVHGYNNGGAGLVLSAHEMAKIGMLYLNKGVYEQKRIVSEQWVEKAIAPYVETTGYGNYQYGFGWWLGTTDSIEYAYGLGWAGQFIFIVPELQLTITATHSLDTSETDAINNTLNTRAYIVDEVIKYYRSK